MNQIKQVVINSVYLDEDNKHFREVLLKKMVELEIRNRRDERINQILEIVRNERTEFTLQMTDPNR